MIREWKSGRSRATRCQPNVIISVVDHFTASTDGLPHQGIEGNETADEWAKLADDEPDAHGVEWLSTTDPDGKVTKRDPPLPRSLANVMRGFSEQKWADSKN